MRGLFIFTALILSGCFGSQAPAPVTYYGANQGPGSSGIHNVNPGDTLYSLSQRYNIDMQDIVYSNNLHAPFTLQVGQRITLPPPRTYRVRDGDTLHAISRVFNVSPWHIAQKNDLQSPYVLRVGQMLNLPSPRTSAAPAPQTTATPMIAAQDPKQSHSPAPAKKPIQVAKHTPNSTLSQTVPKRASSQFLKPAPGNIISSYGPKTNGLHNDGINIAAPRGTSVMAADNGVVVYAGDKIKGSGNLVLLRHDNGWMTAYAHLDKIIVTKGTVLKRGQKLGTVGSTGSVSTPQLHFEVRKGTHAVNPAKYLEG